MKGSINEFLGDIFKQAWQEPTISEAVDEKPLEKEVENEEVGTPGFHEQIIKLKKQRNSDREERRRIKGKVNLQQE